MKSVCVRQTETKKKKPPPLIFYLLCSSHCFLLLYFFCLVITWSFSCTHLYRFDWFVWTGGHHLSFGFGICLSHFCFRSRRRSRRKRTDARQVYVSCAQWCLSPLHLYGLWLCVVFFCECPSDWLSVTPERETREEEESNLSPSSHLLLLLLLTVFFLSVYYFWKFQLPPLLLVIFLVCEIYFWNRQTKKDRPWKLVFLVFVFQNPFFRLCVVVVWIWKLVKFHRPKRVFLNYLSGRLTPWC